GEGSVPDFAAARAAEGLRFTGGKGREVVVEHEALPRLSDERVDLLLVRRGAERGRHDRLRLAALEEPRAVHARQEPDLARNGPDGARVATVDAPPAIEHHAAHDVRLTVLEFFLDELREHLVPVRAELTRQCFDELLLQRGVPLVARVLLADDAR